MHNNIRKVINDITIALSKKEYSKALLVAQQYADPKMTPQRKLKLASEELEYDAKELVLALEDQEDRKVIDGLLVSIEYNASLIRETLDALNTPQPQQ